MKLPSFKTLIASDFEKIYKKLVDQLSLSLNNGVQILYTALNNNLSLRDNLNCTVKDVLVTVDANGKPTQSTAFTLSNSNAKVDGITVIMALNQSNTSVYVNSQPFITGTQSSNTYIINNITGLQVQQQYLIRVVAWHQ